MDDLREKEKKVDISYDHYKDTVQYLKIDLKERDKKVIIKGYKRIC